MRTPNLQLLLLISALSSSCSMAYDCQVRFYEGSQCAFAEAIGHAEIDIRYVSLCGEEDDTRCVQGETVECCIGVEKIQSISSEALFLPENARHVHLVCQTGPRHEACQPDTSNSSDWPIPKIVIVAIVSVSVAIFVALACWPVWSKHCQTRPTSRDGDDALDATVKTCDDDDTTSVGDVDSNDVASSV